MAQLQTVGRYVEAPGDPHLPAREQLLASDAPPLPAAEPVRVSAQDAAVECRRQLAATGLASVLLDEPMTDADYIEFGALIGTAMPETDPAVQGFVVDGVVLNVRSDHGATADVSLQPFATSYLTLHSESSGRPLHQQPRYISLMCCDPGEDEAASQTVLVPMAAVAAALSGDALRVLTGTRYRVNGEVPTIARYEGGRPVFSFRDFFGQPLDWESAAAAEVGEVNQALRDLLAAMYECAETVGTQWKPGLLVVLDNTVFFHGKRAGGGIRPRRPRHLKRLRLLA